MARRPTVQRCCERREPMDPHKFQIALASLIPLLFYFWIHYYNYLQTQRFDMNWRWFPMLALWPYAFFCEIIGDALWSFSRPLFAVYAIANTVFVCWLIMLWMTHYWRNQYPEIPDQVIKTECALLFVYAALICAFSITDSKMNPWIAFPLLAAILICHIYFMKRFQHLKKPPTNHPSQDEVIEAGKFN